MQTKVYNPDPIHAVLIKVYIYWNFLNSLSMCPHIATTLKVGAIITCILQVRAMRVRQVKNLPSITQLATSRAGVQTQTQPSPELSSWPSKISWACPNNRKDSSIRAKQRVVEGRRVNTWLGRACSIWRVKQKSSVWWETNKDTEEKEIWGKTIKLFILKTDFRGVGPRRRHR